jgi:hypothetical protein
VAQLSGSPQDLKTGALLTTPIPVAEGFTALAFIDNQRILVAGDNDTTALVSLDPQTLVKTACALVGRNLTHEEFAQYLPYESYHKTCSQWPAGN